MVWATNWLIALRSLRRNKLQTALTMLGMTIGVATVLTMISLGSGAQKAIQDQVKAAGMNMLIVTAGNFQARKERPPDDAIEMGDGNIISDTPNDNRRHASGELGDFAVAAEGVA